MLLAVFPKLDWVDLLVTQPRMVSKEEFLRIFETPEDHLPKVVLTTTTLYHPVIYSERQPLDLPPCVSKFIVVESSNILRVALGPEFEADDFTVGWVQVVPSGTGVLLYDSDMV